MTALAMLGLTQKELDEAVTQKPNVPSRLLADPMWREKNLTTTAVMVEFIDGKVSLIPDRSRADAPVQKAFGKDSIVRTFRVPHLSLQTTIRADQIQDVRKAGTADALLSNAEVVADEIAEHRNSHDATIEHLMLGAVKGKIVDADGSTIIYDLFSEFGITEPTTSLQFSSATADLGLTIEQTKRAMKKALKGDVASGCTVLCSPEFFDALVSHKSTKEAWLRYQDNVLARENTEGKFAWKGMNFEIYDYNIGATPMIEAGHAHAYLTGMRNGFVRYNAPGNMMTEANKLARAFYIDAELLEHKRGVSIYTEGNPLPMCLRPQTLMHFKSA
uniref:Major capsid protein n=1 Tax=Myoviridae sp. ctRci5 TaxID=2825105 RepID=A0A8S5V6L6_9CAUD|nr:MAG TPA: Major capsid protein [Myoviridae sp. ctRci5]